MPGTEQLLGRARSAASAARYTVAARYLEQVVATGDADAVARAHVTQAYIQSETGDPGAALALCELVLAQRGLDPATRGKAYQQLGLIRMRTGATELALEAFASAIAVLAPDSADQGFALLNRGNVYLQTARVGLAAADFAGARDRMARAGLALEQAKAEHNLGYTSLLVGDLIGAMEQIDRASRVLAPSSAVNRATVEQDRAEILTAAGRPREAIAALESAASAYGSRGLRTYQAECELTLAWTMLREDPPRARVVARRAARRFRAQASPGRALRADTVALVAEISAGARTRSVLARADDLSVQLRTQGHVQDATLLELQAARVCVVRRDLDSARERLRRTEPAPTAPVPTRLLWREVRAELAIARGDRRHAHDHVRAGLADLHAWQSSFGSLDLQSTLVGHGRTLAGIGLRLAVEQDDASLVYEWSERARALVGRVPPVRPPADEELAADLTELRVLGGTTGADPRVEELRERVRRHQWYAEGAGAVGEHATLEELRAALATDDAAVVAHLVVDDRVHALVLTATDAHTLDLGPLDPLRGRIDALVSDLTMAAAHRHDELSAPVRASLRGRLEQVAAQLVGPVGDLLGGRRVVLTPSGALSGTPWPLLPGLVGRPVTIPPSATRWLELRRAPRPRSVGLVAGPGVDRGEEEVTRAAAAWPGAEVLCGPDATVARVAETAERVDVLHLAGHGRHTRENPLFSAVELADGPWFGYDVDQLARTPATVVLSACELGRVTVRSGEEAIGMSAAWLHAGARTVLSSPVLIADDVACEVMARWHALVAGGAAPADALAEVAAGADDVVAMLCFGGGW